MQRCIGGSDTARDNLEGAAPAALWLVSESSWNAVRASLPTTHARWAESQGFTGQRHRLLTLPTADGSLAGALWGLGEEIDPDELGPWDAAPLPERLPLGCYRLMGALKPRTATQFCLGWLLGAYRFDRLRS
ncbi:MAG TPA: hypothetical protein VKT19_05810, partial [Steroidobacteraceae bacterium]|nr:hypothetical protein [Steroidobacteraceae bacterium]